MFTLLMGISVHVYETVDEYVLRNKHNVSDKLGVNEAALALLDIWITPDDKLMVVCNCENFFDRPDVSRSISCFQKNNVHKYLKGDEKLVKYDDVEFDPKTENIQFFKKRLRKAPIFFRVGRFWGNKPRKTMKIDWSKKFFNIKLNRIEFILFDPKTIPVKPKEGYKIDVKGNIGKKISKNDTGIPKNRG